jgi:phosphoglycerol transferase
MTTTHPATGAAAGAPAARPVREALLCLAGATLAVVLSWYLLDLRRADPRVPLCEVSGDAAFYSMLAKGMVENGWVYHNPSLGAPFGLDLHDFPLFESLHLGVMKGFTLRLANWAVILNAFYLATFPLTAVTAVLLLRRLGVPPALSLAGALLYAFAPYHLMRGQTHLMLSAYYMVPLQVLACLWLFDERGLGAAGLGRAPLRRSGRAWAAVAIALAASGAGHYYACFGCFFFLVAGARASVGHRRWRNLGHALLLIGVTAAGFAAQLAPSLRYWAAEGPNRVASAKSPEEAETYGLKLVQVVLPVPGHRIPRLAELSCLYNRTAPLLNENSTAAAGAVAAAGVLALLGVPFLRRRGADLDSPLGRLAVLNLAGVLLATVGGVGTFVAYAVSPQIRGFNRISIFLALFGLAASAWLTHRALARVRHRALRAALTAAAGAVLLAAGLYDQVPPSLVPDHEASRAAFRRGKDFGAALQRTVPPGTSVFQLPANPFPIAPAPFYYSDLEPYLHTQGLRWSYPAMISRRAEPYHRWLERQPPERLLNELARAGFGGLLLDTRLDRPRDRELLRRVGELTGQGPLHDGGTRYYFDLRGYGERLRSRCTAEQWRRLTETAFPPLSALWGAEFRGPETEASPPREWRWCLWPEGRLVVVNHSDRTVTAGLRLSVYSADRVPRRFTVSGPLVQDERTLPAVPERLSYVIRVPPGRHPVVFRLAVPGPWTVPLFCFAVEDFSLEAVADDPPDYPPAAGPTPR